MVQRFGGHKGMRNGERSGQAHGKMKWRPAFKEVGFSVLVRDWGDFGKKAEASAHRI